MPLVNNSRYVPEDEKTTPQGKSSKPKPIKPHQWEKIAKMMRIGGTLEDAAALARISESRLRRNINADVHLRKDINAMFAEVKEHHLQRIYDGEKGWQSSAWWLERMYRREYCLQLADAGPEEKAIQIRKIVREQGPRPKIAEPSAN